MAASYFKGLCEARGLADVEVDSAGISSGFWPIADEALQVLAENGNEVLSGTSKPLTKRLVERAHLVITMTRGHRDIIRRRYPEATRKTHMLLSYIGKRKDVEDPVGMPVEAYRKSLKAMEPALKAMVEIVADPKVRFDAAG